LISATSNNINIASMLNNAIAMNNAGGVVQALNGQINFRDALYSGSGDTSISGGSFLSRQLNIFSGTGIVNANVNDVSGVVNVDAGCAHVQAATALLDLGTLNVSGDPTYYNTAGSIN